MLLNSLVLGKRSCANCRTVVSKERSKYWRRIKIIAVKSRSFELDEESRFLTRP